MNFPRHGRQSAIASPSVDLDRPLAAAAGKPRIEVAILQAIGSEISKTRKPIMIRRFEIMFRCEYRNAFSLSSFDHRDCRCLDGGNDELGFCPDP
jgi:hypothetical protein